MHDDFLASSCEPARDCGWRHAWDLEHSSFLGGGISICQLSCSDMHESWAFSGYGKMYVTGLISGRRAVGGGKIWVDFNLL